MEPRPKPEMTLPSILYGYGGSGPVSMPTISGRVDIVTLCVWSVGVEVEIEVEVDESNWWRCVMREAARFM